jgi:hypothetical protein
LVATCVIVRLSSNPHHFPIFLVHIVDCVCVRLCAGLRIPHFKPSSAAILFFQMGEFGDVYSNGYRLNVRNLFQYIKIRHKVRTVPLSLDGMNSFSQDALFQCRLDAVAQHQVYFGYAKNALQVMLSPGEVKQSYLPAVKLHKQIDIAYRRGFVSDHGSE